MAIFATPTRPPQPKSPYVPEGKEPMELVSLYINCRRHYGRTVLAEGAPHGAKPSVYPIGGRGNNRLMSFHHTASPPPSPTSWYERTGPPTGDEDNPTQRYRPMPSDANRPPGFEMRNGMIVPALTAEELISKHRKVQEQFESIRVIWMCSAFILLASNLLVAFTEQKYPFGIIALFPFLILLLIMWNRRDTASKLERKIEEIEIEGLLSGDRPRSRGTVTVRR